MFLSKTRLCSCGTKPQHSGNPWYLQLHDDIIMRTQYHHDIIMSLRITGKPKFSCSRGPKTPLTIFELGIKHHP